MRTSTGRTRPRNRANWLRDSLRNPTPNIVPGLAPGADPHVAAAPNESKVYPLAGDPSAAPAVHLSAPQGANSSSSAAPTTGTRILDARRLVADLRPQRRGAEDLRDGVGAAACRSTT